MITAAAASPTRALNRKSIITAIIVKEVRVTPLHTIAGRTHSKTGRVHGTTTIPGTIIAAAIARRTAVQVRHTRRQTAAPEREQIPAPAAEEEEEGIKS